MDQEAKPARDIRAAGTADDDRPLMFHLWFLLKVMRESADASYADITPLPSLSRQILLTLHRGWGQDFPALCALIGKDKAQVSRALGRLAEGGHITRARARGPLALTAEGDILARRLTAMAQIRNDRMLAGLDAAAVADLHTVTELLILRANQLYEAERALGGDTVGTAEWPDADQPTLSQPAADTLLVPRLIALLAYAQRSMALAAKRLVAMPAFDTLVLSFVVGRAPLAQAVLVAILSRDQSQAARTIRRLIADGLIVRTAESTRRSVFLAPTEEGLRIDAVMAAEVARRDAFLTQAITAAQLATLRHKLAWLSANAAAMGLPAVEAAA